MPGLVPTLRIAFLGGLIAALAPVASAWEPVGESTLPTTGEARALVAGTWGGKAAFGVLGTASARVIDATSGALIATVDRGGIAMALVDHDGDGASDVVLCADDGVWWARGDGTTLGPAAPLTDAACKAMAYTANEDGTRRLVTVAEDVYVWPIGTDGALGDGERFGTRLIAEPLLAATGSRFAVGSLWGTEIQESSEWGRSTYTAHGPIRGLSAAPRSWAWSILGEGVVEDVTRRRVTVSASPGLLRHADLDGNTVPEVLVVHPNQIGVVEDDVEKTWDAPNVVDLAAADVDGNGCAEVAILASDGSVRVLSGHCPPKVLMEAGGEPVELVLDGRDAQVDAWVGQPLRLQLRDPMGSETRFSGRGGPEGFAIGDDGLVTWLPESDDVGEWAVSVRMWGGADLVRVVSIRLVVQLGFDAGPGPSDPNTLVLGEEWPTLQILVGETAVVRLQDGVGQSTSFRWHGGPPGLQIRTDGLARYTAMQEHIGQWRVDVKVTGSPTRKTGFMLRVAPRTLVSAPTGSAAAVEAQTRASVPREPKFLQPRGCMVSIGFAAGLTGTEESWENVGQPVYASFSPSLAGTCEGGRPGGFQWFAGADTAPVYAYVLNADAIGVHTLVGTVGFSFGGDDFRIGPYASAGILMTGLGIRTWWLPFATRGGTPHGFEFRLAYVLASTPSGQAMVMYGWRFGRPR